MTEDVTMTVWVGVTVKMWVGAHDSDRKEQGMCVIYVFEEKRGVRM